ncbi:MAG: hypothetical protein JNM14_05265 [Ferruginibacter sp.]|nr:hypothetical protein [Ferruginibacter sp.]
MKLLIVTFLKDYQEDVQKIFKQAQITAFSIADVTGFKDGQAPDLLEDWFASGDEKFDSQVIFSFTENQKAELALELANNYNTQNETKFPVRAFIVPVEKSNL